MVDVPESPDPIVVEQTFAADPEHVWRAVTDPERMREWYFATIEDFRPEVGFETEFDVDTGERVFRHRWTVNLVEPGRRIRYEWRYGGYDGLLVTDWSLSERPEGTVLRLVCTGIETFPQTVPELTRESCEQGWDYFLRESLAGHLASQ